jgi:hypothetical protein
MKTRFALTLLVVVCGWLFFICLAQAQLVERWRVSIPDPGWSVNSTKHAFDGEGNTYILRVDEADAQHIFLSKISPDGDLVWSVDDIPYQQTQCYISNLSVDLEGNSYVFGYAYQGTDDQFKVPLVAKYSPSGQRLYAVAVPVEFGHSGPWAEYGGSEMWPDGADSLGRIFCSGRNEYRESENVMRSHGDIITVSPEGVKLSETIYYGDDPSNSFWQKRWEPFGPDMYGRYVVIFEQYAGVNGDSAIWHFVTYDADGNIVGSLVSPQVDENNSVWGPGMYHVFETGNFYHYSDYNYHAIEKYSPDFTLQWTKTYSGTAYIQPENPYDQSVMILENGIPDPLACYNADGSLRWRSSVTPPHFYQTDFGPEHDIYSMVPNGGALERINYLTGELVWNVNVDLGPTPGDQYHRLRVDNHGVITWCGYYELVQFVQEKYLTIRDAHGDSIPNTDFDLIRMTNNPPLFDEHMLGTYTTDSLGRLAARPFAPDSFYVMRDGNEDSILVVGDSLKIAKHVCSIPAVKHEGVLGTMYSIHLDNGQFAEDGHMFFDTLTIGNQDIVLNHTELRYDLLVSVQWEATEDYLTSLEGNIRAMSDYLYDVTDGQARIDTVFIFDHDDFSIEADLYILASNMQRPEAEVFGIKYNHVDPGDSMSVSHAFLPRIWMGDSVTTRNYTGSVYPLDLVTPSKDYRAKAHELGHYLFGFYDEYLFWNPDSNIYSTNPDLRCLPVTVFRYGYMDSPYESEGEMTSEMSNAFRYDMETCRNTNQYLVNGSSCWDFLESQIEASTWGEDSLFVPILKPDASDSLERIVSNPGQYFPGPNDDLAHLDYDVGSKIEFPNPPSAQAAGYYDKRIRVHHSTGGDNADVRLLNDLLSGPGVEIDQGRTSDSARAWVVGINGASFRILASKGHSYGTVDTTITLDSTLTVSSAWLYGMADSVDNNDSLIIELNEVQGDYPVIFTAEPLASGITYTALTQQPFPTDPSVQLWPDHAGSHEYELNLSGNSYSTTVTDTLGICGTFVLWASDDSSATFFVPTDYTLSDIDIDQPFIWLFGRDAQSEFKLDSTNLSLTRAIILSSSYPVIRTGLDENAVQAGQAHCLAVYSDNPLEGSNQVVIRYDDADLKLGNLYLGDEATLAVFRWVDAVTGWESIGGTVDTIRNEVYASIEQTGVYAAFTNQIITDIDDNGYGDILPYQFELSQNYPNPFNPITTIQYWLPEHGHVTIEVYNILGQRLRTLVDCEESAGAHTLTWDGTDAGGTQVATGVYLYRFKAGDHVETRKMLLLK